LNEPIAIVRLGHKGDGVAADGTFIPYTVPGDVVRLGAGPKPRIDEILTAGPSRTDAACRHFGTCGGCTLQHVAPDAYFSWKRDMISLALAQRGFESSMLEDVRAVGPGSRRRASFKARCAAGAVSIGYYEPQSHLLVDLQECPILVPALFDALPKIANGLMHLLSRRESVEFHVTSTDAGLDVSLKWKRAHGPDTYFELAEFAQELKLARLSWNGETVAVAQTPYLRVGNHIVLLPVEPFLQPTSEGEAILQSLVCEGVEGAIHVADLFAGCGTFTLALTDRCSVSAVEKNAAMATALEAAARERHSKVGVERRDLFGRPLLPSELSKFDVVILDPPRLGAKAQALQLAKSDIQRVVYVSCNPTSFARDARILCDSGFRLRRVVPIDQFLWSAHVELVAFLERDKSL
jgi:23S rRNA (uracil1939-C5)-methyltransferase